VERDKESVLPLNYRKLSDEEKMNLLMNAEHNIDGDPYDDALIKDTLDTMHVIKKIQELNGTEGCSRYIISQCNSALNVAEVIGLFLLCGWKKNELPVDIVPLFETVEDMQNASAIMKTLYQNPFCRT
jgi:phosphoenolpyruvate carboxylase